jgi:hypothetical protein
MLRRTVAGWDMPQHTPPLAHPGPLPDRFTERTRWLWLVPLVAGFAAVVGYVLGHDPGPGLSIRGWVTLAAAGLLVVLITIARNGARLLRTVAEYVVVAVLAVLLATAGAGTHQQQPAHQSAQAGTAAGDVCPEVLHVRAWLACLWHQASKADQQPSKNGR